MLRATTACTFSTSQLPKVVRAWCALYILTSKRASHHNGVHFFISHLARWLRTRRFSEPTFRPSGALNFPFLQVPSQTSFVFDVVKFKQALRKSRRLASFLTLSSSNIEGVSQNCLVFDVVKFKH